MAGPFVHAVYSWRDMGTSHIAVIEILVCGNRGFASHLAQEARHKARALRVMPAGAAESLDATNFEDCGAERREG
jgi:hypothetical protein